MSRSIGPNSNLVARNVSPFGIPASWPFPLRFFGSRLPTSSLRRTYLLPVISAIAPITYDPMAHLLVTLWIKYAVRQRRPCGLMLLVVSSHR